MHTLWGKPVRAIDCSDGFTAAITQDGKLFTWGGCWSLNKPPVPHSMRCTANKTSPCNAGMYHCTAQCIHITERDIPLYMDTVSLVPHTSPELTILALWRGVDQVLCFDADPPPRPYSLNSTPAALQT